LAGLYRDQARYPNAEPLFRRALTISEKAFGLDHPNVAICLENLAQLYRDIGYANKALPLERRAAEIRSLKR